MEKRILYLVRNAQYDREQVRDDEISAPLTSPGKEQAALTAHALKDLHVNTIYASPERQTMDTAAILSRNMNDIEVVETNLLRQYPSVQSASGSTLHPDILKYMAAGQKKQLDAAFNSYFKPVIGSEQHEIIVCHANIIRDLICRALSVNPETWAHMIIHHCGISSIIINADGTIELAGYNDTHHLPDKLRTEH